MKPYTPYTALLRRPTKTLEQMLDAMIRQECECDSFHGYTCPKHARVELIKGILADRMDRHAIKRTLDR